jgi:ATP-binding cassette, subfamily B (MDR/TAP), member 1
LIAGAFVASIGAGVTLPLMQIVFGNLVGGFNDYFEPGSETPEDAFRRQVSQQA